MSGENVVGVQTNLPAGPDPKTLDPQLRNAVRAIARVPQLLVSSDYDGTLAPIVPDPAKARPLPLAVSSLRRLAALPETTVAVVSGRALRDLAAMSRLPVEVQLVGSHGAEFDLGDISGLDAERTELLRRATMSCSTIISDAPGAHLEPKPAGVAVHVRRASPADAHRVLEAVRSTVATWEGIHVTEGKAVIELAVVPASKDQAIAELCERYSVSATIYIGDDITDENVFANLAEHDLGVKVGDGDSKAGFRLAHPDDVITLLALIAEERQAWLAGANAIPIENHALLADGTHMALITPHATVSWLCYPGPDAPAVFAELLGDPEAGHLAVAPVRAGRPLGQSYLNDTMTLRTRWAGVTVTDYLDSSGREVAGRESQLRLVRVISGTAPVRISFAPRPQFGAVNATLEAEPGGVRVVGSADAMVLRAPGLDWTITQTGPHQTATATADPSAGDIVIEFCCGTDSLAADPRPERQRRSASEAPWIEFARALRIPARYRRHVLRSALTLRGLCYEPTGAALAAATTSLPEWLGGIRNWDYRYCWLRDAALTVQALAMLGSTQQAEAYLDWLSGIFELSVSPDRVHPLYGLDGTILGPEAVVDTLPGYAGSRPVRIGNAAQGQVQLDVFGPICSMVADVAGQRGVTMRDVEMVTACVEAVSRRWEEDDHGIWEIRDAPRPHVHSRVMGWVAVDRALEVVHLAGLDRPDWQRLRDVIATDILTKGFDPDLNSFVSAYGRHDVDAGSLSVINYGLVPGSDPRALGTIQAVEAHLRDGPTVYRYRHDDGLPGAEGGMHLCTAWLIEAYLAAGMLDEAEDLFGQLLDCAGPTDLLPEMHDPGANRGLGNHPHAYSHLGVIRCALKIAERRDQIEDSAVPA